MNAELRRNKQVIREFLRTAYSDERLAMLLAHAQEGKLAYYSCCCLIGVATADHALAGRGGYKVMACTKERHYQEAKRLGRAVEADKAYMELSGNAGDWSEDSDAIRIRRVIPIVRAEMRRRERERAAQPVAEEIAAT